mmetsp:Transcript_68756/g.108362  ORF Transcript_68756/g.108362 Transcript_68756/m.108362 type:complete len:257 (-) Transcript_68756:777-1547(-)
MRQADEMRSANCSGESICCERCRPCRASSAFHHGRYSSSSPNILQKVSSFSGPEPLSKEATVCAKVCRGRSSTSWSHWSSSRFSCNDNSTQTCSTMLFSETAAQKRSKSARVTFRAPPLAPLATNSSKLPGITLGPCGSCGLGGRTTQLAPGEIWRRFGLLLEVCSRMAEVYCGPGLSRPGQNEDARLGCDSNTALSFRDSGGSGVRAMAQHSSPPGPSAVSSGSGVGRGAGRHSRPLVNEARAVSASRSAARRVA